MTSRPLPLLPAAVQRGLLGAPPDELLAWLQTRGQPPMRARQLRRWIVAGRATAFEQMTDLPARLRNELAREFVPLGTTLDRRLVSCDGTHKLLLRLHDGQLVECVLLKEADRRTVCISTQVGCGMGCVFCASGIGGVVRNLAASEILEQLLHARNLLPAQRTADPHRRHGHGRADGQPRRSAGGARSGHGAATGWASAPGTFTSRPWALPAKMRRLADLGKQYHLAVSLHAPNERAAHPDRARPTPKTGLDAILAAADYFYARTGRQVTYEYVLLRDLNDRTEHAAQLARLLRGRQAHVNLIPVQRRGRAAVPADRGSKRSTTSPPFCAGAGVSVKVRKRKGADIDAACGQLRRSALPAAGELPGRLYRNPASERQAV